MKPGLLSGKGWKQEGGGGKVKLTSGSVNLKPQGNKLSKTKGKVAKGTTQPSKKVK